MQNEKFRAKFSIKNGAKFKSYYVRSRASSIKRINLYF